MSAADICPSPFSKPLAALGLDFSISPPSPWYLCLKSCRSSASSPKYFFKSTTSPSATMRSGVSAAVASFCEVSNLTGIKRLNKFGKEPANSPPKTFIASFTTLEIA